MTVYPSFCPNTDTVYFCGQRKVLQCVAVAQSRYCSVLLWPEEGIVVYCCGKKKVLLCIGVSEKDIAMNCCGLRKVLQCNTVARRRYCSVLMWLEEGIAVY